MGGRAQRKRRDRESWTGSEGGGIRRDGWTCQIYFPLYYGGCQRNVEITTKPALALGDRRDREGWTLERVGP